MRKQYRGTVLIPLLVACGALLVLYGWTRSNLSLIQISPGFAPMQFNTALCFLLIALSFFLHGLGSRLGYALTLLCGVIAGITGLQYIFGANLGIDTFFIDPKVLDKTTHPGRMSPTTAIVFCCLSINFLLLKNKAGSRAVFLLSQSLLLLACALSFSTILGYTLSLSAISAWTELARMALHTGVAHLSLVVFLYLENRRYYRNRPSFTAWWHAFTTFSAGCLCSIALWTISLEQVTLAVGDVLAHDSSLMSTVVQNEFDESITKLNSVERFFSASSFVSAEEFDLFTDPLLATDSSMVAIDWSPKVTEFTEEKVKSELSTRSDSGFLQLDNKRHLSSHLGADIYFPVFYSNPRTLTESPLGFDHYSDELRTRTMDRSAREAVTATTEPFRLFRLEKDTQHEEDLLVFVPVFSSYPPKEEVTSARSPEVQGFVIGVFRLSYMISSALKDLQVPGIEIDLESYFDDGSLRPVYLLNSEQSAAASKGSRKDIRESLDPVEHSVFFADRELKLHFRATPAYINKRTSEAPLAVFGFSMLLTVISSFYILFLTRQRERIEQVLQSRSETLKTLEESEALFKQLAFSAPIGIFRTDSAGQCCFVNPAWEEIAGISEAEALSEGWVKSVHPEDRELLVQNWFEQVEQLGDFETNFRFVRPSGEVRWVAAKASPLLREDGSCFGYVGSNFDVTELQNALEARSRFLASMSHEIRTPMNSILGFSKRLLKKAAHLLNERDVDALLTIDRNAEHLLALINDILDYSKIESGNMALEKTGFDLLRLCRENVKALEPLAEAKGIPLELISDSSEEVVLADRKKVSQILNNLLSNAVKYTDSGKILVKLQREPEGIRLTVQDSGIGIKESDIGSLFQQFTQLTDADHRKEGGTGLGLCIAKEYAQMHGGDLSVESEWGKGSSFSLYLPDSSSMPLVAPDSEESGANSSL